MIGAREYLLSVELAFQFKQDNETVALRFDCVKRAAAVDREDSVPTRQGTAWLLLPTPAGKAQKNKRQNDARWHDWASICRTAITAFG